MARKKRSTDDEMTERRKRIHEMHLQAVPSWQIAVAEKITRSQVTKDLKAIYATLAEEYPEHLQRARLQTIARHELVIEEAWEQWDRSKLDAVRDTSKAREVASKVPKLKVVGKDGKSPPPESVTTTEASKTTEGRLGDASYLQAIMTAQKAIDEANGLRQNVLVKELQEAQDELRAKMKAAGHLLQ